MVRKEKVSLRKYCFDCGVEISLLRKRCVACAKKAKKYRATTRYCECGAEIQDKKKRCGECAEKVKLEQWRKANGKESKKAWKVSPAGRASQARNNHKRRGSVVDLSVVEWGGVLKQFDNRCAYCGDKLDKGAHREHFVPLSKGGHLTLKNVVPSCEKCNLSKGSKNPLDWLVKQTRGLVAYVKVIQYLEGV